MPSAVGGTRADEHDIKRRGITCSASKLLAYCPGNIEVPFELKTNHDLLLYWVAGNSLNSEQNPLCA